MKTKQWIPCIVAALAIGLAACSPRVISNSEGRRGTVRDAIYAVEPRQNGAYAMWLRYDDIGVYCINDQALYDKAKQILTQGSGWAIVEYHTVQITELSCKNIEDSNDGQKHTIYVVNTITQAENQN